MSSSLAASCHALILAGGSGTRLWPLSRALFPKQLLALNGKETLLQQTLRRTLTVFAPENIHIITNEEHLFEVKAQAKQIHPALAQGVLAEPLGRNTLPAILLGLDAVADKQLSAATPVSDAPLLAVLPSDHTVQDVAAWSAAMGAGMELAAEGHFVTFGIPPTNPETGYGYIHKGKKLNDSSYAVQGFVEKPSLEKATQYLTSGEYAWNSGIFIFNGASLLAATQEYQPELAAWWKKREQSPLIAEYSSLPDVSVDYGIMEHASPIAMVDANFGWDDLGNWAALYRLGEKDAAGCVVQGDALTIDCEDCLLFSRGGGKLVAIGLKDVVAVQTHDATLVCSKDQVHKVKDAVTALKQIKSPLADIHLTVRRPWGSYTILEEGTLYKIKRIVVHPGASLSLQMHHHRSEHWVVIKGAATVRVGDNEIQLAENQSVDIPVNTMHRLSNPGKILLEIIEIQSGPYLEEDDIVRFDDVYGRVAK